MDPIPRDLQFHKFRLYGFLKNLKFFEPYILLFFLENGINFFQIGILFAVREIGANLLEIPGGVWADSFGRRRSMIIAFGSYIISFLFFFFLSGFYLYLIAMFFFSIGDAFRTGTHKAMILTYLELKGIAHLKVAYYGQTRAASQFGSAVSALLAMAIVLLNGNYRAVFLAATIPYLLELLLMISYPGELDAHITREISLRAQARRFGTVFRQFGEIFKNRDTFNAMVNSSFFSGVYNGCKEYLQPILRGAALSSPLFLSLEAETRTVIFIGIAYFVIHLATSQAAVKSASLLEIGRDPVRILNGTLLIGFTAFALSGLGFMLGTFFLSALFFITIYVIENLRKPLSVGYVADRIDSHIMASGLSAVSQLKTVFSALVALAIGTLAQLLGIGAAITVVALFTFLVYPLIRARSSSHI